MNRWPLQVVLVAIVSYVLILHVIVPALSASVSNSGRKLTEQPNSDKSTREWNAASDAPTPTPTPPSGPPKRRPLFPPAKPLSDLINALSDAVGIKSPMRSLSATAATPAVADAPVSFVAPPRPRYAYVGLTTKTPFQYLYQFVRSARESCVDCAIILFVKRVDLTDEVNLLFSTFDVTAVEFDDLLTALGERIANYHPSSYRWILKYNYLKALDKPFDAIFLADVRDTVIQRNPFETILNNDNIDGAKDIDKSKPRIIVFMEGGGTKIAACGWNSGWVKDCYGQSVLNTVGHNLISCSGTTLAHWPAALEYLSMMNEKLTNNTCERNGVDQGIHNVLVHTNVLTHSALIKQSNERGMITTVQNTPVLHRNAYGYVLNDEQKIVSVVHQIDRSSQLLEQYKQHYNILPEQIRNLKN